MFNLLKKKETVQEELLKSCFKFYENLSEKAELILADTGNGGNIGNDVKTLERLGFNKNSKVSNYKSGLTDYNKLKDFVKFYVSAVEHFGQDTIVIPNSMFFNVLLDNNLIVGEFNDFIGEIPTEELKLIDESISKVNSFDYKSDLRISTLEKIDTITTHSGFKITNTLKKILNTFPYFCYGGYRSKNTLNWAKNLFNEDIAEDVCNKLYISNFVDLSKNSNGFFIAAPANEFSAERLEEIQIEEEKKFNFTRIPSTDPIIFCLTNFGCLCTNYWGEEKNIPMLQKFREASYKIQRATK